VVGVGRLVLFGGVTRWCAVVGHDRFDPYTGIDVVVWGAGKGGLYTILKKRGGSVRASTGEENKCAYWFTYPFRSKQGHGSRKAVWVGEVSWHARVDLGGLWMSEGEVNGGLNIVFRVVTWARYGEQARMYLQGG
jgi:hypothetical protein